MLRSRRDVPTTSTRSRLLLDVDTKKEQKKISTVNNLPSFFFGAMLLVAFLLFLMGHGANVHTDKSVDSGLRSSSSSSGHAARKSLFSDTTNQAKLVKDKKGKVLHHAITSVKQNDLAGLVDDEHPSDASDGSPITYEQAIKGREKIVAILNDAGVSEMDPQTILKLPKWSSVTKLYGEGPVVHGLERCAKFQETAALDDASIGTAGIFNTGTNPFAMYVEANCVMPHNTHDKHGGMRWQV
jgi:hypothetical protein